MALAPSKSENRLGRLPDRRLWFVPAAALLAVYPFAITSRFWLNVAVFVCIYIILAAGLTLLFGYANQVSFWHAGFYGTGAYVSALTTIHFKISVWLGLLLGMLAAAALGYVIGRPILRLQGLSLAMATFAFGLIMGVLFTQLRITGGPNGLSGIPEPRIGPLVFDTAQQYYWLALAAALLTLAISHNIARSHVGRALRALGSGNQAAEVAGIDTASYKARVFAYSAGAAGFAGALYAHYITFVSDNSFSVDFSILVVVILAIGGRQTLWGAVVGAIFLTIVPEFLRQGAERYALLIYGIMLTVVFMYLPGGLVGVARLTLERVTRWRTATSSA